MNTVEIQSLFRFMKDVDTTVGDIEPQRLQLNPKRYNEPLQIVHDLHRQNGTGELGNGFVDLLWGSLGHGIGQRGLNRAFECPGSELE